MRLSLWPQSLFGRLLAATVAAVLVAQATGLLLIAQERERFVLQGSVREWTRRIVETTLMLPPLAGRRGADGARRALPRACARAPRRSPAGARRTARLRAPAAAVGFRADAQGTAAQRARRRLRGGNRAYPAATAARDPGAGTVLR